MLPWVINCFFIKITQYKNKDCLCTSFVSSPFRLFANSHPLASCGLLTAEGEGSHVLLSWFAALSLHLFQLSPTEETLTALVHDLLWLLSLKSTGESFQILHTIMFSWTFDNRVNIMPLVLSLNRGYRTGSLLGLLILMCHPLPVWRPEKKIKQEEEGAQLCHVCIASLWPANS